MDQLMQPNLAQFLSELDELLKTNGYGEIRRNQLRTAAIRLRERSLPDPFYERGEAMGGAKFWLKLALSAPNFR